MDADPGPLAAADRAGQLRDTDVAYAKFDHHGLRHGQPELRADPEADVFRRAFLDRDVEWAIGL
ncbi:hypothetical protein [Fimbriiglobus ruber]|uniref:hypothetical protein n=1 Tax=Fimbriiglobus ruber TaxID=1908690 RepID=UPI00137AF1C7|nr:hypothetical protein [Fimbriiglobus ruber]